MTKMRGHQLPLVVFVMLLLVCGQIAAHTIFQSGNTATAALKPKPLAAPSKWRALIGEYGPDNEILYVLEQEGKLSVSFKRAASEPLEQISRNVFKFATSSSRAGQQLVFERDPRG